MPHRRHAEKQAGTLEKESRERELLFEYEQLRQEILQNDRLALNLLGGTVTLTGILTSIAFSSAVSNPLAKSVLFFLGATVALWGLFYRVTLAQANFTISSYIRVFPERDLKYVKWQTRAYKYRKNYSIRKHGPFVAYEYPALCSLVVVYAAFGLYQFYARYKISYPFFLILFFVTILVFFALYMTMRHVARIFRSSGAVFDDLWTDRPAASSRVHPAEASRTGGSVRPRPRLTRRRGAPAAAPGRRGRPGARALGANGSPGRQVAPAETGEP